MNKTTLEHFQDIKEIEISNNPYITIEGIVPYKCRQIEKALKAIETFKKYFCIKFSSLEGNKIDFISIQAWSDLDTFDTSAYETIKNNKDIKLLKEVFGC